ncbi:hypothetical protein LTS13_000366 [Exophiala xenobiotica]|nr:hypothetical protein LTS13_000366 [Exophiala xenobiotica]KAK5403503.1 hypothetical protein LTR79_000256 [Exophiala xenobiotica]KAK5422992.1 hypothetical protein LTR90_002010 [Exophiala xenobiotica]KAK5495518.1 hypothetical protein LTR26_002134 [Exophiala xenobiotica]KAK5514105.1 hypothetical protein LTR07_008136 [Exophiala xenobiotica]
MTLEDQQGYRGHVTWISGESDGRERDTLATIDPAGFYIRPPPNPHELDGEITDDSDLFQTIHMGAAVVNEDEWRLVVDGLVERPFAIDFAQLKAMHKMTITSFHECYGSPIAPPTKALWRIGNVRWTGVRLADLLRLAQPKSEVTHVWSWGLDHGTFAGASADRYEKDLTLEKARAPEVLIAYEMNEQPLGKKRGGPVRLVVPGWFGTNSTKWLCRLSLQSCRASGPFTTRFYNEIDPTDTAGRRLRPVWAVEPNSMIVRPKPGDVLVQRSRLEVWGRTWGCEEVVKVDVSVDGGQSWVSAVVTPRKEFEWQLYRCEVASDKRGSWQLLARATDKTGVSQPLTGRRNHVHTVDVEVI